MTEHIETKHKLKEIHEVKKFNDLLDKVILTDEEKQILILHYLKEKDLGFIADELGYTVSAIKRKHGKILKKLKSFV